MTLARTEYYRSGLLNVRHVACRGAVKGTSDVESADADSMVMPLRGAFLEHFSRGTEVLAEPNIALLFPAGRTYRVSHPVFTEDDCLTVEYSARCFQEALEHAAHALPAKSLATHSLLSPGAMAARNLLWRRLARNLADPLEVEETGVALLSHALGVLPRDSGLRKEKARLRMQIDTARVVLLSHPERKWSLSALARAVECSPFHLTRMFRAKVGVPLHRYQLRARLARAIDLLLDSDKDLAAIALDLGFSSHSHFTAAFQRMVGLTPRKFREAASSRIAAQTRKILISRFH